MVIDSFIFFLFQQAQNKTQFWLQKGYEVPTWLSIGLYTVNIK
jgi:hypothetical protein